MVRAHIQWLVMLSHRILLGITNNSQIKEPKINPLKHKGKLRASSLFQNRSNFNFIAVEKWPYERGGIKKDKSEDYLPKKGEIFLSKAF